MFYGETEKFITQYHQILFDNKTSELYLWLSYLFTTVVRIVCIIQMGVIIYLPLL